MSFDKSYIWSKFVLANHDSVNLHSTGILKHHFSWIYWCYRMSTYKNKTKGLVAWKFQAMRYLNFSSYRFLRSVMLLQRDSFKGWQIFDSSTLTSWIPFCWLIVSSLMPLQSLRHWKKFSSILIHLILRQVLLGEHHFDTKSDWLRKEFNKRLNSWVERIRQLNANWFIP